MIADFEDILADYATKPSRSRGRLHVEAESESRSPFQRDRDRIIHCSTFRRLKHKTQVFVFHEGDYYRTRLTHSIEVAQIARSISRTLHLNEDLAEALSLAHDFGHTAFGHAGEEALDAAMQEFGGFDHNAQSLRLVTLLEQRYGAFDGLNLTWETLEGLAKHNGPLVDAPIDTKSPPSTMSAGIREYLPLHDLEVHTWPGLEAQVSALSDDIAYNNHDIDDGLRAGLFSLDDLGEIDLIGERLKQVRDTYSDISDHVLIHELVRRLINMMVMDLVGETETRLADLAPGSVDEIREAGGAVAAFSDQIVAYDKALKAFLKQHMYAHFRVNRMASKGKRVVTDLFDLYIREPECLPPEWSAKVGEPGSAETARFVADFIAGMTDRYALREHQKLFDLSAIEI